jgi:uncharacterized repeat protein (TIGR03837 family)
LVGFGMGAPFCRLCLARLAQAHQIMSAMLWDLFCRVIDNHGDVGVCWRLASTLAARGERVRLWIDDARALAWMAPEGDAGVEVRAWPQDAPDVEGIIPGEVVIEAFGCELPPPFIGAMARRQPAPAWVNLEYLSAEPYAAASHRLRSPQFSGPGKGLDKWFFYPGFTPDTGGLLRQPNDTASTFDDGRIDWLARLGCAPHHGERVVTLFCYDNPTLPQLLDYLAEQPTLLLATPGHAQRRLSGLQLPGAVRRFDLPWLTQADYDRLLRCADLNLVRGEDSFVRAMWAQRPFVWHIYPQDDGAHADKLEAFLSSFAPAFDTATDADAWKAIQRAWNQLAPWPAHWPDNAAWVQACQSWCAGLVVQPDLCTQLQAFVHGIADERR